MTSSQNESALAGPAGEPAIRVLMMPRDTNVHGTIFGGVILSHIDQAGAVHARSEGLDRVVTVAMDAVEFQRPVFVGDLVSLFCETIRTGRTSIAIFVDVWARRFDPSTELVRVTSAQIVYVNVDEDRNPVPIPG
ncbi:MAG: hotdog domain-containing protein [Planctomycetota bacterium]